MQSFLGPVISESPDDGVTRRSRGKTGGMLLALAAAVTAGTILTARHNGWEWHAHPVMRAAVVRTAQPVGGAATIPAAAPVLQRSSRLLAGPTLYLTGTAGEAATAQAELDGAARMIQGSAPMSTVAAIVAPGEEAELRQAINDQNRIRATLSLPEIVVMDLRAPASETTNAATSAQQAIADENRLRVSLGLPELTGIDTERVARQAIADENQLRSSLGLPELNEAD